MKHSNLSFCIWTLGLFISFAGFSLLNWLFLVNSNDHLSAGELAKQHLKTGGILGSIVHSVRDIKVPAYMEVKPEIVALGTSRSTLFRDYFFTKPFFNLSGGAINSQVRHESELRDIYQAYFSNHKPSLVLMTLDYWAYTNMHPVSQVEPSNPHLIQPLGAVRLRQTYLPTYHLFTKRIGIRDFLSFSLGLNKGGDKEVPRYGFTAIVNDRGMLKDGSLFRYRVPELEIRFKADLDGVAKLAFDINQDPSKWSVNSTLIDGLANVAKDFERQGVKMVFILAPVAPSKLTALKNFQKSYSYIDEIRSAFLDKLPNYFDLLDPQKFGSGDCEFEDGNHGGEVTYLRMLLEVDRIDKNAFNGGFAVDEARALITEYENLTVTPRSWVGGKYFKKFGKPVVVGCSVL